MALKIKWTTPSRLSPALPHRVMGRNARGRVVAAAVQTSVVDNLRDHLEHVEADDVDRVRLRTALNFHARAPRVAALASPSDVARAFQNALWRSKCQTMMAALAKDGAMTPREQALLQQAQFAMRLDQRIPSREDAAALFFQKGSGPRFSREAVPALQVFKTEIAGLNITRLDVPTCKWLEFVRRAVDIYEDAEAHVALADPVTLDIDYDILVTALYHVHDLLMMADASALSALGDRPPSAPDGKSPFERACDAVIIMCLLRLSELDEVL